MTDSPTRTIRTSLMQIYLPGDGPSTATIETVVMRVEDDRTDGGRLIVVERPFVIVEAADEIE